MKKASSESKNSNPTFTAKSCTKVTRNLPDIFQEMFQSTKAEARTALFQDDQLEKRKSVRQMCDEFLSAEKPSLQDGSQHRTREGKSWPLARMYSGGNFIKGEDLKFTVPFSLYTKNITDCSSSERKHCIEEIAAFEDAAQALSLMDNKENNFQVKLSDYQQVKEELRGEPKEKKRKDDSSAAGDANDESTNRESYWERRKKNNASAKKSRDARKAREQEIQIKAAFLERENLRMLTQLMMVLRENECLKRVLCAKYEAPL